MGAGIALSPLPWKLTDDSSIWTQMWPWTPVPEDGEYKYVKEKMKLDEEIPVNQSFTCVLGIRPEMVEIETEDTGRDHSVAATVYASQPAGSETLVTLTVGNAEFLAIQIGLNDYEINQKVHAVLHPSRMNVYNKATGRLIKFASAKRIK